MPGNQAQLSAQALKIMARSGIRKAKSARQLALDAYKLAKKNQRNITSERGYLDGGNTETIGYDTPMIVPLTEIIPASGSVSDPGERIGDTVKLQSVYINGVLQSADVDNPYFARVMVVQSISGTALSTVSTLINPSVSNQYDIAFRDLNNTQNFRVLYDKIYKVSDRNGGNPMDASYVKVRLSMAKKKNRMVKWTDGDTDGTSYVKNQLYLLVITNQTDAAGAPTFRYQFRTKWIE